MGGGGEGIFLEVSAGEVASSLSEGSSGSSSQDSTMGTFFLVGCFWMVWLERERCVRPSASSRRVLVWGEDWRVNGGNLWKQIYSW